MFLGFYFPSRKYPPEISPPLIEESATKGADLPSSEQKIARPRSDDRLMLNSMFRVLCSDAAWRDLPERFGPEPTVYQRVPDWRDDSTIDQRQYFSYRA